MRQERKCLLVWVAVVLALAALARVVAAAEEQLVIAAPTARAVLPPPAPAVAASRAPVAQTPPIGDGFEGYDFEQVVTQVESSVDPLQKEMSGSFQTFAGSVQRAEDLLEAEKPAEAVEVCSAAIDEVIASRDQVLDAMWKGQEYLTEQVGWVRDRLAKAVGASGGDMRAKLDRRAEAMLDAAARRIAAEADPQRKKRLVAHYRMLRQLARTRMIAQQLSPDQRKMWRNVLKVLDDTALAHQQVLMGTEVLFAQFEATAANLREYRQLLRTVEGASRLLGVARGLGEHGTGLAKLSENMAALQQRMDGFNTQVEQMLQGKMIDLESQVDSVTSVAPDNAGQAVSSQMDTELLQRLGKLDASTTIASKKGA